jgi:hypothetical protein
MLNHLWAVTAAVWFGVLGSSAFAQTTNQSTSRTNNAIESGLNDLRARQKVIVITPVADGRIRVDGDLSDWGDFLGIGFSVDVDTMTLIRGPTL